MLNLILQHNIFEYDSKLYRQLIGTSMGSKPAPDYSNNFMARRIDLHIKTIARKYTEGNIPLLLLKPFLDDILTVFVGSTRNLHKFISEINKIHPAINFTMSYTSIKGEDLDQRCSCPEQNLFLSLTLHYQLKKEKFQ